MRIVSHRKLKDFFEVTGREDSKIPLEKWYAMARNAQWHNFSEIRSDYPNADYVGNQHYVFNIKGNHYRLIVVVKFTMGYVFIRWVGTHQDYDKIDPAII